MKIIFTFFLVYIVFIVGFSQTVEPKPEVKINSLKPVKSNVGSKNKVNPVIREQMSDDSKNPQPIPFTSHQQTEPNENYKFIEKWQLATFNNIISNTTNTKNELSEDAFIEYHPLGIVVFRLNSNSPIQTGKFYQFNNLIKIIADKKSDCTNCINEIKISRNSDKDVVFSLIVDNATPNLINVNVIK